MIHLILAISDIALRSCLLHLIDIPPSINSPAYETLLLGALFRDNDNNNNNNNFPTVPSLI